MSQIRLKFIRENQFNGLQDFIPRARTIYYAKLLTSVLPRSNIHSWDLKVGASGKALDEFPIITSAYLRHERYLSWPKLEKSLELELFCKIVLFLYKCPAICMCIWHRKDEICINKTDSASSRAAIFLVLFRIEFLDDM